MAYDPQRVLDALMASDSWEAGTAPDLPVLLSSMKRGQPVTERAYNRHLRERCQREAAEAASEAVSLSREGDEEGAAALNARLAELVPAVEAMLALDAADDFDAYMQYMEWGREPQKRFYLPRRKVLLPLVRDLQDLFDDRLDFLSISMPPRTGKSTMCIFFLTFVMGNHPDRANVMTGHSDKLTSGFHMEALSIICDEDTYRFAQVFPESPFVAKDMANETVHLGKKRRFPTLTCRSIDGTLTGAVEVGRNALLYCDDLVSDREEALNSNRMDKLYNAYLNQLKDRMLDGAKQLFVATRWVPNDPIGRIEAQYAGNPRYRFTTLPALDGEGESNFTYGYGLGFSTAYYEDMRASLVEAGEEDSWAAKYMCAPYWRDGLMFPADSLNYYSELPEGEPDAVVAVCDTKEKGSDYCVQPVVYVYGDRHYVHSVVCDDSVVDVVTPRLVESLVANNVRLARYESNAGGGRVARTVEDECRLKGHAIEMRTKYSTANKDTRIMNDAPWIKTKCLFRADPPDRDYRNFMRLLTSYTVTGKNPHDDAADAMSMYARFSESMRVVRCEPVCRPW